MIAAAGHQHEQRKTEAQHLAPHRAIDRLEAEEGLRRIRKRLAGRVGVLVVEIEMEQEGVAIPEGPRNVAASLAKTGAKTALIDMDLIRGGVASDAVQVRSAIKVGAFQRQLDALFAGEADNPGAQVEANFQASFGRLIARQPTVRSKPAARRSRSAGVIELVPVITRRVCGSRTPA